MYHNYINTVMLICSLYVIAVQFISAEERNVYCHFCMFVNTFTEQAVERFS